MEDLIKDVKTSVKHWWVSLAIGIVAIILGFVALFVPLATLLTLGLLFGWVILLSGILMLVFAISNRKRMTGWGWYLASGIIDIVIGLFLVISPGFSMAFLLMFVGLAILFQSIWAIGVSIELQTLGSKQWGWLLLLAILGIILSFVLIINPAFAASFIVILFAMALIVYGIFRISYAFDLKKFGKDIKRLKDHVNAFRKGE